MRKIETGEKVCELCGSIYKRTVSGKGRISPKQFALSKFCSRECKDRHQSQILSGENNVLWKGGKPKCLDCGKRLSSYRNTRCKKCWYIYHRGTNHAGYKVQPTSYKYIHTLLRQTYGAPQKCERCGVTENLEWANKDGNYTRDIADYFGLCVKCHRAYDANAPKWFV